MRVHLFSRVLCRWTWRDLPAAVVRAIPHVAAIGLVCVGAPIVWHDLAGPLPGESPQRPAAIFRIPEGVPFLPGAVSPGAGEALPERPVPEPGSAAVLALGVVGVLLWRRA